VRARFAIAAALAVGLSLGTAGCTFFAPQATLIHYDPSDGIGVTVGAVDFRNMFVVSDGTDANLIGAVINHSDSSQTINFQYTDRTGATPVVTTNPIELPANTTLSFGNPGQAQLVFRGANAKPGSLLRIFIQYGTETGKNASLPVLDNSIAPYGDLTPSPTPTPIPTISATAKPVTG
jgi:hypothetical protein